MPDTADQLRRDLLGAIEVDAAATRTGDPDAVRARGRRRQQARGLLVATTVLAVAAGATATLGLPVRDDEVVSRPASSGAAAPFTLDEGNDSSGPWTLVVTEQHCLEHTSRYTTGGMCGLDEAGRLEESSSFRTEDDGEPVVVVNGPVQDGTSAVRIGLAGLPSVDVSPALVDGSLYFSARAPADVRITGLVAMDDEGRVLARREGLPSPPS